VSVPSAAREIEFEGRPVSATSPRFATAKSADAAMRGDVLSRTLTNKKGVFVPGA
jgi:hypothetical protein